MTSGRNLPSSAVQIPPPPTGCTESPSSETGLVSRETFIALSAGPPQVQEPVSGAALVERSGQSGPSHTCPCRRAGQGRGSAECGLRIPETVAAESESLLRLARTGPAGPLRAQCLCQARPVWGAAVGLPVPLGAEGAPPGLAPLLPVSGSFLDSSGWGRGCPFPPYSVPRRRSLSSGGEGLLERQVPPTCSSERRAQTDRRGRPPIGAQLPRPFFPQR